MSQVKLDLKSLVLTPFTGMCTEKAKKTTYGLEESGDTIQTNILLGFWGFFFLKYIKKKKSRRSALSQASCSTHSSSLV